MDIDRFLQEEGWSIAGPVVIPERQSRLFAHDTLGLSTRGQRYLSAKFPKGLYGHQVQAISYNLAGDNVCMLTSTASGKSVPFYIGGIETITREPRARIIAIYPLKALGREQEERWTSAIAAAGLDAKVGRIDGAVPIPRRLDIIRNSHVVIMTPDVIHAWLLSSLGEGCVRTFLRYLRLLIVDETHSYTGVFGSNAAFLFRRLQHVVDLLGGCSQYICASATMANPEQHLLNLFGANFRLVSSDSDTSPRPSMRILLARPDDDRDLLASVSSLLLALSDETKNRFICFVDSRKQTEHISAISARSTDELDDEFAVRSLDLVQNRNILPYRSGYEERDRAAIQQRLSTGTLQGVVSTSALEMGIDVPGLTMGVLVGVPQSSTSLYQRIGRIGRDAPGTIIVVNAGSLLDESSFAKPSSILERPLGEGALYLGNHRIQYIHAMCLARPGGEHDLVAESLGLHGETNIQSNVQWPEGFLPLCKSERLGELAADLQQMKMQAGESPNHVFPLRDVEVQYGIEIRNQAPEPLGSLSHSQLMREAYPGAVYYHITRAYRVVRILHREKTVHVRHEKRYTTKPSNLPTLIYPNLTEGNVYNADMMDQLLATECNLQVREAIAGFKERRGSNEIPISYPTNSAVSGVFFDLPLFTRNFFTSGVIVSHPALDATGVKADEIAELVFEAFAMSIPFERRDIGFACDKLRQTRGQAIEGARFLAIYDQTYGSLRLSRALMNNGTLRKVMELSFELAQLGGLQDRDPTTMSAVEALVNAVQEPITSVLSSFGGLAGVSSAEGNLISVVIPGSKGWSTMGDNQVFSVIDVFMHPSKGLQYRGVYENTHPDNRLVIPLECLLEIPGESLMGSYNLETGEIEN